MYLLGQQQCVQCDHQRQRGSAGGKLCDPTSSELLEGKEVSASESLRSARTIGVVLQPCGSLPPALPSL